MIKEKLVHYSTRLEQLKQFQQNGDVVSSTVPFGLKPGMQPIYLSTHPFIQFIRIIPMERISSQNPDRFPSYIIIRFFSPGEKYKPPPTKKKKSGLFGKKEKKTWGK